MLVIICYDIFDDRRRLRVMNAIEGYGYRVQGSVYECHLDKRRLNELKQTVSRFINQETDRVRYYTCQPQIEMSAFVQSRNVRFTCTVTE